MMESSYGSGTPTILSWQDEVTSTGLSSVPQGASNLHHRLELVLHCDAILNLSYHMAHRKVLAARMGNTRSMLPKDAVV